MPRWRLTPSSLHISKYEITSPGFIVNTNLGEICYNKSDIKGILLWLVLVYHTNGSVFLRNQDLYIYSTLYNSQDNMVHLSRKLYFFHTVYNDLDS